MPVIKFRLSGNDYTGEVAQRMYDAALPYGYDQIEATIDPWPIPRPHVEDGPRFIGYGRVCGVSAHAEIAFDSVAELIGWLSAAKVKAPDDGTAAYAAIVATLPTDETDREAG